MSTTIAEMMDLPIEAVLTPLKSYLKSSSNPEIIGVKRLDPGRGFLSIVAQLKLKWSSGTNGDNNLPSSVVVKMPTVEKFNKSEDGMRADENKSEKHEDSEAKLTFLRFLLSAHNYECKFYNEISGSLTGNLYVPLPHVYYTRSFDCTTELRQGDYGLIIMEDLVGKGRTPDFTSEDLTEGQMQLLINSIASLHAYCILNPDWNKAGLYRPAFADLRANLTSSVISDLIAFRSLYPAEFTASDEEISKILDPNYMRQIYSHNAADIDYFPILVHGDLWLNNTIFGFDKSGNLSDSLVAIVDWQTVQPGPVTDDFTFLTATSVDSDVRRANTHRWLKFYYQLLGEKLPKGQQIPFSFDEVVRMHKKTFRLATLSMCVQVAYVMRDPLMVERYSRQQRGDLVKRLQKNIDDSLVI